MNAVTVEPIPRDRRHTLHFLRHVRPVSPVFLDTEVDMGGVRAHRAAADAEGTYSVVTYVLHAAAQVLTRHPAANAAIRGGRIARYPFVHGKLTLDKTLHGQRVVLSAVLPDLDRASLRDVQRMVEHYRDGDPERMPEFAAVRRLDRLPRPLGAALFRLGVGPLRRRARALGTFAVTSLGHGPVDGFYSSGGTTITLGLGRITDRPVVRDGRVVAAPMMRLSLTFDHRVIDGAEAADVLAGIKDGLEGFHAPAEVAVTGTGRQ